MDWNKTDYTIQIQRDFSEQLRAIEQAFHLAVWTDTLNHYSANMVVWESRGDGCWVRLLFCGGNPTQPGVCPCPTYLDEIRVVSRGKSVSLYAAGVRSRKADALKDYRLSSTSMSIPWVNRHRKILTVALKGFGKLGCQNLFEMHELLAKSDSNFKRGEDASN